MEATKTTKRPKRYRDVFLTVCFAPEEIAVVREGADPLMAVGTWARIVLLEAAARRTQCAYNCEQLASNP